MLCTKRALSPRQQGEKEKNAIRKSSAESYVVCDRDKCIRCSQFRLAEQAIIVGVEWRPYIWRVQALVVRVECGIYIYCSSQTTPGIWYDAQRVLQRLHRLSAHSTRPIAIWIIGAAIIIPLEVR